ncbi:MAG TPA: DoxX family protein [Sorangium sp.]|nr:DoxX family protein [Sorangium sp.]
MHNKMKTIARYLLAAAMTLIGLAHFVTPLPFVKIVPRMLPAALVLVLVSGACEVLLGAMLLPKRTRRWAGWGLIALYVAVFPANVNMAVNGISLDDNKPISAAVLWARLPFQLLFIAWAYWVSRPAGADTDAAASP